MLYCGNALQITELHYFLHQTKAHKALNLYVFLITFNALASSLRTKNHESKLNLIRSQLIPDEFSSNFKQTTMDHN